MSLTFHHPVDVLRYAGDLALRDKPYALVVVTKVTGGTMRAQGALMCVPLVGDVVGYISNGCVDADIIFQAKETIEVDEPRRLIYGEGSPFKDIKLPCGGRIELLVSPQLPPESLSICVSQLKQRQPARLDFNFEGISQTYSPKLKIRIAGKGESVTALAQQALGAGFDVIIQTPEPESYAGLEGLEIHHLIHPETLPAISDDPWTAVVLMFHDHDWEPGLLQQALRGKGFYIGAMGSERTHLARCEALLSLGVNGSEIDRISGPIGLIPSMRDANLLALSTLGEIVKMAQKAERL